MLQLGSWSNTQFSHTDKPTLLLWRLRLHPPQHRLEKGRQVPMAEEPLCGGLYAVVLACHQVLDVWYLHTSCRVLQKLWWWFQPSKQSDPLTGARHRPTPRAEDPSQGLKRGGCSRWGLQPQCPHHTLRGFQPCIDPKIALSWTRET